LAAEASALGCCQLDKELAIPVLACAQLNRECEQEGRRPRLSDLRDSGSLEQDADLVLLLHPRESDTSCPAVELILAKHRNGPVASVPLRFQKSYTRFVSAARDEDAPDHA
jgi:replicative DNA helicase